MPRTVLPSSNLVVDFNRKFLGSAELRKVVGGGIERCREGKVLGTSITANPFRLSLFFDATAVFWPIFYIIRLCRGEQEGGTTQD